jgi:hypothetical protein
VELLKLEFCTVATGDLRQIQIKCHAPGNVFQMGLQYIWLSGTLEPGSNYLLAQEVQETLVPLFQACMSQEAFIDEIDCFNIAGDYYPPGRHAMGGYNGTVEDQSGPNQAAAVLTKYTDAPSANMNGRLYVGGLAEQDQANGLLSTELITNLGLLATGLMTNLASVGTGGAVWVPVVVSRWIKGLQTIPTPHSWVSTVIRPDVYSQNRRQTRREGFTSVAPAVLTRHGVEPPIV